MGRGTRWYVVVIFSILYAFSQLDRFIPSLMVDAIKRDFQITDTQIGLLLGPAFVAIYAGLGIPIAWLIDRSNRIWVAAAGVLIWGVSTVGSGFASNFSELMVLRMMLALGEAALTPAAVSVIADVFGRHERSAPMATFVAIGGIGSIATYAVGGAIMLFIGSGAVTGWPVIGGMSVWRATFVIVGVPTIVLGSILLATVRDPTRASAADATDFAQNQAGIFESRRDAIRFYASFFAASMMLCITVAAIMSWFPSFLVRSFGVTVPQAGFIVTPSVTLATLVGFLTPIVAQRMARRGRADALIALQLVLLMIGFPFMTIAVLQDSVGAAGLWMILGFGSASCVLGFMTVVVALTAPAAYRARLTAIGLACSTGIGFGVGPFLTGFLSEHLFDGALGLSLFAILIVAGPLSCLFTFLCWKPYRIGMTRAAAAPGG